MDSATNGVCPGCGEALTFDASSTRFKCHHCGEELVLTPDRRVFLAHPIAKYNAPSPRFDRADIDSHLLIRPGSRQQLSEDQRRQTSAELATQKLARRKKESDQLSVVGAGVLGLGVLVSALTITRLLLGGGAWIDLALSVFGILVLIPVGVYLVISSLMVTRLLRKQEQELEKERAGP